MKLTISSKDQNGADVSKDFNLAPGGTSEEITFCQTAVGSATLTLTPDDGQEQSIFVKESRLIIKDASALSLTVERAKDPTQHHFAAQSALIGAITSLASPVIWVFLMLDSSTLTVVIKSQPVNPSDPEEMRRRFGSEAFRRASNKTIN